MNLGENCQFVKMSSSSTKLLFDHCERPVGPLSERWIGEHMSMGHERVFGMYGTKTRKLLR